METYDWTEAVREDIASFRDLGSEPVVLRESARGMSLEWQQNGARRSATFRRTDEGVTVEFGGRTSSYGAFLAGRYMADLRSLADSIARFGDEQWFSQASVNTDPGDGLSAHFVPVSVMDVVTESGSTGTTEDGLTYLSKLNDGDYSTPGVTSVTFVLANAGQGKSQLLRRSAMHEAKRYLKGDTESLLLYVDAQGSGLAMLNQAVAASLDNYRSQLIYQNVQALVREGLITLVIDGFDELLGARGTAQDAFSSLSAFVDSLGGRGAVVASGRSAYYQHEFSARATRFGVSGHKVRSVKLLDWTQDQYFEFAEIVAESRKVDLGPLKAPWYEHSRFVAKPFFAAEVIAEKLRGSSLPEDSRPGALVDGIVNGYITREVGKFQRDGEIVLDEISLARFYREVAEEMWQLETRELDPTTLRLTAELVFDDLDELALDMVVQRAPYLALLTIADSNSTSIRFEHEIFYSYFIAENLSHSIVSTDFDGTSRPELSILERGLVPSEAAEFVAQKWVSRGLIVASVARVLAGASRRSSRRRQTIRENSGSLLAALSRLEGTVEDVVLESVDFKGLSLSDVNFVFSRLIDVNFESCDLSNARFIDCSGTRVSFNDIILSGGSRLEIDGLVWDEAVLSLRVHEDDRVRSVYDPSEISRRLHSVGFPGIPDADSISRGVPHEVVEVVGLLADAFTRMNPVGELHDNLEGVFDSPVWPSLRDALSDAGLIESEVRAVSGPKQMFYRKRFDPSTLMRGLDQRDITPEIERFWSSMSDS